MKMFKMIQDLFEMAYERKKALEIISGMGSPLANHMILLQHCTDSECDNHWKNEVDAFLSTIDDSTYLKKKARLKTSDLVADAWDGPMGEYEDYLRRYNKLKSAKPGLVMTPPSDKDWDKIKAKYMKAFELIQNKITPTYDTL